MRWGLMWLDQGGPVMYVLLGVSVVGVAFFFYAWLVLRKRALFPAALVKTAETVTDDAGCAAVENLCRSVGGPLAEIFVTVIASRQLSKDEADTLVEGAGRRTAHYLSRGVLALEIVATISPLLGLLGTVTGMHAVFAEIANNPSGEIGRLSGGIAEAILTTIAGLVIAVPAYVAHGFFSRRVEALVLEMERLAFGLMLRLRN